jgi:hypothetical protein
MIDPFEIYHSRLGQLASYINCNVATVYSHSEARNEASQVFALQVTRKHAYELAAECDRVLALAKAVQPPVA